MWADFTATRRRGRAARAMPSSNQDVGTRGALEAPRFAGARGRSLNERHVFLGRRSRGFWLGSQIEAPDRAAASVATPSVRKLPVLLLNISGRHS
jgi:hypothetical protein